LPAAFWLNLSIQLIKVSFMHNITVDAAALDAGQLRCPSPIT
jgi:hypothetical protein